MPFSRTLAPLLGLIALAALPPATRAAGLFLNDGDAVTVDGTGTHGTIGGNAVSNNTTSYFDDANFYAVETNGTSTFTLGSGSTITGGDLGLWASGSGPVTVSGGTITADGFGVDANGNSLLTISGGTITAGPRGNGLYAAGNGPTMITGGTISGGYYGLFANGIGPIIITGGTISGGYYVSDDSTVDLYGDFGQPIGTSQTLPHGQSSFFGTLQNNAVGQTFSYYNIGTITLHNFAFTAAPEPSPLAVLGIGGLGIGALVLKAGKRKDLTPGPEGPG